MIHLACEQTMAMCSQARVKNRLSGRRQSSCLIG